MLSRFQLITCADAPVATAASKATATVLKLLLCCFMIFLCVFGFGLRFRWATQPARKLFGFLICLRNLHQVVALRFARVDGVGHAEVAAAVKVPLATDVQLAIGAATFVEDNT